MNTTPAPKFELRYVFDTAEDMLAFQSLAKGLADPVVQDLATMVDKPNVDNAPEPKKPMTIQTPMTVQAKYRMYLSEYLPAMLNVLDFHGLHLSKQARADWMNIQIHLKWCEVSNAIKMEVSERILTIMRKNYCQYADSNTLVYRNIPMAQRRFAYLLDHPDLKEVGRGWKKMLTDHKYDVFDKAPSTEPQALDLIKGKLHRHALHEKYHSAFLPEMLEVYLSRHSLSKEAQKEWHNINICADKRSISAPAAVTKEVSARILRQLQFAYEAYLDKLGPCHDNIHKCKQRFAYTLDHPDLQKLGPKSWITIDRNPAYANM